MHEMDGQLAALRSLDTRMCADAHVELRRAVSCASDLFEANIKCLAQISRQQQDRNEERNRFREESEVTHDGPIRSPLTPSFDRSPPAASAP